MLMQSAFVAKQLRRDSHRLAALSSRQANGLPSRSSQSEGWWAVRDLNPRHPRCKRGALPLS